MIVAVHFLTSQSVHVLGCMALVELLFSPYLLYLIFPIEKGERISMVLYKLCVNVNKREGTDSGEGESFVAYQQTP